MPTRPARLIPPTQCLPRLLCRTKHRCRHRSSALILLTLRTPSPPFRLLPHLAAYGTAHTWHTRTRRPLALAALKSGGVRIAAARRTHHHPHGLPPHALPDSCCPLPTVRTRVPLPHTFARRCPAPSSLQGLYVGTTSAVILNSATFSGNTASQVSKDAVLPLSTPHTHTQAHTPSHVCADAPRTIAAESHEPPRTCPRGRLV